LSDLFLLSNVAAGQSVRLVRVDVERRFSRRLAELGLTPTGAKQHVGNWPGKTVEKKEGKFVYLGQEIQVVDLPGTYSLSAFSPEEVIARDFIVQEKPDVIVIVVDATNLERNLYLAVQVLEMEVPVVLALNMVDMAVSQRVQIQEKEISRVLGVPVICTVARREKGLADLLDSVIETVTRQN
jgi:ferrous iron transport protein B